MNAVDQDILALRVAIKAIRDGLYEIAEAEARVRCLQDAQGVAAEQRQEIGFIRIECEVLSEFAHRVGHRLKVISDTSIAVNDDLKRSLGLVEGGAA